MNVRLIRNWGVANDRRESLLVLSTGGEDVASILGVTTPSVVGAFLNRVIKSRREVPPKRQWEVDGWGMEKRVTFDDVRAAKAFARILAQRFERKAA